MVEEVVTIVVRGVEVKVSKVDMARVEEERWGMYGGYATSKKWAMHKMIMGERPVGVPAEYVIDHKDRDKRNNTRENLRWVSASFNIWNAVRPGGGRFRGVRLMRGRWEAIFKRRLVGSFAEEREAARAVAREAIREWGEWAEESDLLFVEGLLTEEDRKEIKEELGRGIVRVEKRERELPRGVRKKVSRDGKRIKYEANCGKRYIGGYETAEEAREAYEAFVKGKEEKEWEEHRGKEITRDKNGVGCVWLSGKVGEGQCALVSDEDWHEMTYKKAWYGSQNRKSVYAKCEDAKMMHREVYRKCNEELGEGETVDHKNGDTLDNRRENLRRATKSEQAHNKRKRAGCSSEYIGVRLIGSKWCGNVMKEGKNYSIGRHKTEDEAALAYNRVAAEVYGENAQLNVVKKKSCSDIRDYMKRAVRG